MPNGKKSDPFRAQFFEFGLDDYLKDFERLWWLSKQETLLPAGLDIGSGKSRAKNQAFTRQSKSFR